MQLLLGKNIRPKKYALIPHKKSERRLTMKALQSTSNGNSKVIAASTSPVLRNTTNNTAKYKYS
jgi:hypothetical protein